MGKTKYPDTNNQFAFRTNREAFLRGIQDRAETFWMDGYRVSPFPGEPFAFLIFREGDDGGHKVNPVTQTCSCKFCTDQNENPLDLQNPDFRVACKHLQGLPALLDDELAYWKMRYDVSEEKRPQCPRGGCEERSAAYFARWNALSLAWAQTQEEMHRNGCTLA